MMIQTLGSGVTNRIVYFCQIFQLAKYENFQTGDRAYKKSYSRTSSRGDNLRKAFRWLIELEIGYFWRKSPLLLWRADDGVFVRQWHAERISPFASEGTTSSSSRARVRGRMAMLMASGSVNGSYRVRWIKIHSRTHGTHSSRLPFGRWRQWFVSPIEDFRGGKTRRTCNKYSCWLGWYGWRWTAEDFRSEIFSFWATRGRGEGPGGFVCASMAQYCIRGPQASVPQRLHNRRDQNVKFFDQVPAYNNAIFDKYKNWIFRQLISKYPLWRFDKNTFQVCNVFFNKRRRMQVFGRLSSISDQIRALDRPQNSAIIPKIEKSRLSKEQLDFFFDVSISRGN